jgi:hypothetical protein
MGRSVLCATPESGELTNARPFDNVADHYAKEADANVTTPQNDNRRRVKQLTELRNGLHCFRQTPLN